ncbi:TlpA family protein disulfide reductase [Pedobacter africanus]|uniref:Thiol-disulfide isomerase or thioredoxin n=1 Tax=Pedobacter africanus TaxID=151894 RepID=A0A1W2CUQ2_9SPHI|nr:TlpA disulfide reductase family protein [Pedobacter africanus]SMC88622.1 Thiol-disulfide isomerase or thioredoxin [Pedobacter africanus]
MNTKMKKFSRILLAVVLVCPFFTNVSYAQDELIINGIVTGDTKGFNKVTVLYGELGSGKPKETTIVDGKFQIRIPYTGGVNFFSLYTEYESEMAKLGGGGVQASAGVPYDHAGEMNLELPIAQGISGAKITGMPIATEWQEFHGMFAKAHHKTQRELKIKYGGSLEMGDENYEAYQRDARAIMNKNFKGVFEDFIPAHPDSYTSANALVSFASNFMEPEDIKRLYGKLSKARQESEEGKAVLTFLQGIENSGIGKTVQNFTLNTPSGTELGFNKLKGKYVLIDFWASWCAPCKASFPHIKEIYSKYKDKNFEILSISIDKDKNAWLEELKKQQLPWLHMLDTKGVNKSHFLVDGVPTTYLVDPNGKILLKEKGFDPSNPNGPLDELLAKLFAGKVMMKTN